MKPTIANIVAEAVRLAPEKHVSTNALIGGSLRRPVARVRQRAILAALRLRPMLSTVQLGRSLGRDHSSIVEAKRREEILIASDAAEAAAFSALMLSFPPPDLTRPAANDRIQQLETLALEMISQLGELRLQIAREFT